MSLAAGDRIGPYEIQSPLGAGGMGEVYRARDTRLDRDVAIKVLPPAFANDADRRARFEREAKSIAALTHPNIVAIFDTGLHEGHLFVVTEVLDGTSLRDALASGAMPVRKAIEIAVQIARGLAAAHDKGIVHRDLKPENVFLLRDGQVKILDFGLATPIVSSGGASETVPALTDPGTVLGTVGYMSPEQVRGRATDARTDLFALGAVLYEMLTGERAFKGDTPADAMLAVIREDPPDLATRRAGLALSLERIVHHCLEKNSSERFQSARDVAFALEALSGSSPAARGAGPAAPRNRPWVRLGMTALAVGLVAATAFFTGQALSPAALDWRGVALGGPHVALWPRISPDGHLLAFQALVDNNTQLAVMRPDSGSWTVLTRKRNAGQVREISWAPDGNTIYFARAIEGPAGVFAVSALGGDERLILEDAGAPTALPDGSLLLIRRNAQHQSRLQRFWPETGRSREFPVDPATGGIGARVFPDGREAVIRGTLLSETRPSGVHLWVVDVETGQPRRLLQDDATIDGMIAVTPDNQSVVATVAAGDLSRLVIIPRNGRGGTRTLFTSFAPAGLDVGADGAIYAAQAELPLSVIRFPLQGGRSEPIASVQRGIGYSPTLGTAVNSVASLPDGRLIVPMLSAGRSQLMVLAQGKDPVPFVYTSEETRWPVAVVGDSEVAFLLGPAPRRTIAFASIGNGRVTHRLTFEMGDVTSISATPDGHTLFIAADGAIWSLPVAGGQPRKVRIGNSAAVDPTGQRLLVQLFEASKTKLIELPLGSGSEREIILKGPYHLTFDPLSSQSISRDGRLLVPLASPDNWFFPPGIITLATGEVTPITVDQFGDYHFLHWAGDQQVIAGVHALRAAIWRFQPEKR